MNNLKNLSSVYLNSAEKIWKKDINVKKVKKQEK
jgi:hypothetical protein